MPWLEWIEVQGSARTADGSTCRWNLQHGGLRVVGLLTWYTDSLRARFPKAKVEAAKLLLPLPQKFQNVTSATFYWLSKSPRPAQNQVGRGHGLLFHRVANNLWLTLVNPRGGWEFSTNLYNMERAHLYKRLLRNLKNKKQAYYLSLFFIMWTPWRQDHTLLSTSSVHNKHQQILAECLYKWMKWINEWNEKVNEKLNEYLYFWLSVIETPWKLGLNFFIFVSLFLIQSPALIDAGQIFAKWMDAF